MIAFEPAWAAPENVVAFTTLRTEPIDTPSLLARLPGGCSLQRLNQVHGATAINAGDIAANPDADACYSRQAKLACMVVTADCLPLLVCNRQGSEVAAIHAGWRGLAAGVIESTIGQLGSAADDLLVWLGPAISQKCFEVGPEVRAAFLEAASPDLQADTAACFLPGRDDRFMADLFALARLRLAALGIKSIAGGDHCTYTDSGQCHSYRRDGDSAGRMASVIAFH